MTPSDAAAAGQAVMLACLRSWEAGDEALFRCAYAGGVAEGAASQATLTMWWQGAALAACLLCLLLAALATWQWWRARRYRALAR